MTAHERGQLHLPRNFFKNHYDDIDERFQIRPIMNPPHSRDLSQPGDAVYNRATIVATLRPHEVHHSNIPESESTIGERHPEPHKHARSSRPGGSASTPIMVGSAFTPVGLGGVGLGSVPAKLANATAAKNFSATPHQPESNPVNPTTPTTPIGLVNLSSSEASFVDLSRKFGNTSQRQRSLSGHKQIAQATQSTGESLVNTLEKLNECDSKLQWEIFQEQLKYNRQRDLIQQENVRMTHMNQSSLVQAITGLTQVLGVGLSRPTIYDSHPIHPQYQSYGSANHASYAYGMPTNANQPTFGRENHSPQPTTSGVQYTTNFAAANTIGNGDDIDLAATCSNIE
jgi:hypothetical protein